MSKLSSHKPQLLKIIPPLQKSLIVKDDAISWNNPWHYHPEIELLHCIKGKGTNFIGNSIRSIEEGEVLLLGKNLPHTRQRDRAHYVIHPDEIPSSVVVQFRDDFLGKNFFEVPEFQNIQVLFNRSIRGLKFTGKTKDEIAMRLGRLKELPPSSMILELLSILNCMVHTEEFIYLNPVNYVSTANEKSSQKINKVYHFTVANFREPIALKDVASLTHHSPAAFCRYFKTRTRKTYFQYLTEIRIAYACELIMQESLDISQICFASGFNNLSHFHKQFKRFVKFTPSEYRAQGRMKVPE